MGSGHILVYAFDVLMQMYLSVGYSERDAAKSIVENNLYGLDIDDRAAQLAYFALMMKARQYDSRFLTRGVQPHVYAIQESNALQPFERLSRQMCLDTLCLNTAGDLIDAYRDAKEYGSLLSPKINSLPDVPHLMRQLEEVSLTDLEIHSWYEKASRLLPQLVRQTEVLQQSYDVVVTNPPYMGSSGMNALLSSYVKEEYPDSKSDLFACFMERCGEMTIAGGYTAMITQHAWMFLSSYEKLRKKINQRNIINMVHLGARAFDEIDGEVVQTTAFVTSKPHVSSYKGTYIRLIAPTSQDGKEEMFLAGANQYFSNQDYFTKIPGAPVAYWLSEKMISSFMHKKIRELGSAREGIKTGDNERFIRNWQEVSLDKTNIFSKKNNKKWQKTAKAGEHRRWYGSHYNLTNFLDFGKEILATGRGSVTAKNNLYQPAISWNRIATDNLAFRMIPTGFISNMGGLCLYPKDENKALYLLGFLNTKIARSQLNVINPTMSFPPGTINNLSCKVNEHPRISLVVKDNIKIAKSDWDSFENSWDFKKHPLI